MQPFDLYWLPELPAFNASLRDALAGDLDIEDRFARFQALATGRLDFIKTGKLDRAAQSQLQNHDQSELPVAHIKLAILSSCTVDHLLPSIRVAGLRRKLSIEIYAAPYGQFHQEVLDPTSGLYRFGPDVVMFNVDSQSVAGDESLTREHRSVDRSLGGRAADIKKLWRRVQDDLGALVIQQSVLDRSLPLFGNFEMRVPGSPTRMVQRFNWLMADRAADADVLWLDTDWWAKQIGTRQLSDPTLWHQAKQEISPLHAPLFGDVLARQLAAIRGLSRKCLVLDLDNTIWGGVIGDDGIDGIALGQGSPLGEAFAAFQGYAKRLSDRGVILAVCSKNEKETAMSAFEQHPEMILNLSDIAAFEANWLDKPGNIQRIAQELNIGLDALVFFDDNPTERALMRETLPDVAVPEVPEAAELYPQCLADAGYFETVAFTAEDVQRTKLYAANRQRNESMTKAADMDSFLRELNMEMQVGSFDRPNLPRIVQLINKTNQYNLTTRRYTEAEIAGLIDDETAETFHIRLKDRFGDNGIICIVIGRTAEADAETVLDIDTWLMSCRVLGRRVEDAVLGLLADAARRRGISTIRGRYIPTPRNGLVKDHYENLGFTQIGGDTVNGNGGETTWTLPLDRFQPRNENLFKMVHAHGAI